MHVLLLFCLQYSEVLRKVFVRFGQSCPFRFRTSICPPTGTLLRAMPIYTRPQHIQEVVKRCPHHAVKTAAENAGTSAPASHLVRCEHKLARYDEDSYTGFHSVVVPYDHPPGKVLSLSPLFRVCAKTEFCCVKCVSFQAADILISAHV